MEQWLLNLGPKVYAPKIEISEVVKIWPYLFCVSSKVGSELSFKKKKKETLVRGVFIV